MLLNGNIVQSQMFKGAKLVLDSWYAYVPTFFCSQSLEHTSTSMHEWLLGSKYLKIYCAYLFLKTG